MPKQRITKEMIVDAAFSLARTDGMEQVLIKNIARKLGCSVQPIYSYCENMEGLRQEVVLRVKDFVQAYAAAHRKAEDPFRTTGQAYIQLAKEEPHIFKIFILHERQGISSLDELYSSETDPCVAPCIARDLQISTEQAKQLHLHMLIYTIGLGTIFASSSPGISADEIFEKQEIAYDAFVRQIQKGNEYEQ